jgi:hypothetical protein
MACVGCEIKGNLAKIDVEQLIKEQLELEVDIVSDSVLKERVFKCEICPFRSGHTCAKCGCFYKFRANLGFKKCPDNRW